MKNENLKHQSYYLNDKCIHEADLAKLKHSVETLYSQDARLEKTLDRINKTNELLLQEIAKLNTTINTLKWVVTIFVAAFGGVIVFLISELIKLI